LWITHFFSGYLTQLNIYIKKKKKTQTETTKGTKLAIKNEKRKKSSIHDEQ
jgi:hypothetical protein